MSSNKLLFFSIIFASLILFYFCMNPKKIKYQYYMENFIENSENNPNNEIGDKDNNEKGDYSNILNSQISLLSSRLDVMEKRNKKYDILVDSNTKKINDLLEEIEQTKKQLEEETKVKIHN